MHCKAYIVLMVLLGIVVCSVVADSSSSPSGTALKSSKEKNDENDAEVISRLSKSSTPYKVSRRKIKLFLNDSEAVSQLLQLIAKIDPNTNKPEPKPKSQVPDTKVNEGPKCHQIIDKDYQIFSDMCGTLPQARYILPNTFGHNDRGVLSHILTTLMSASKDQYCTHSLRFLLCPMLFQPCRGPNELPLVLPCQGFCNAVKAQCGQSAINVIPCEILPFVSDYCPAIPVPPPTEEKPLAEPVAAESNPSSDISADSSRKLNQDNQPKTESKLGMLKK